MLSKVSSGGQIVKPKRREGKPVQTKGKGVYTKVKRVQTNVNCLCHQALQIRMNHKF